MVTVSVRRWPNLRSYARHMSIVYLERPCQQERLIRTRPGLITTRVTRQSIAKTLAWVGTVSDAQRLTKKSAKPFIFHNWTNQRPATKIPTNGITWWETHFEFWTNQRTIIRFLLASLQGCKSFPCLICVNSHIYQTSIGGDIVD